MTKYRFFSIRSFWRALLVASLAGLFGAVLSILISRLLDQLFRYTGSDFFYALFYTLSLMQPTVVTILWVGIVALFSHWILYPSFLDFSRVVAQSLKLEEQPLPPMPNQFIELEQQLTAIQRDIQLWKYATQEAEKRKDELVVYLAHDIRTPLTSVLGYLELLEESPDLPSEYRQRFTQVARRKAQRMKTLVEELFEITRFNISQIELQKRKINAGVMLRQLIEEMTPILADRQQSVEYDIPEKLPLFVDLAKFARAVDNILHNASNYAPNGTIIYVSCHSTNGYDEIRIANHGTEMSQAELDRYFEKFYRGDVARQSNGGSGLGLAIAKNIVEAHGGTIQAFAADCMITFTVSIPQ